MTARTVFFGTPEFAVPALRALAEMTQVVGVVCQPDRRSGRGMKLRPPPVKEAAVKLGLEVQQPVKVRDGQLEGWLRALAPEIALVVAYGRILPLGVLRAPARGCVNLHASLLPSYRGAAPIQWSLLDGRTETGICLMQMDEGMDTGPVFAARRHVITPDADYGRLSSELAHLAADMVRHELLDVLAGRAVATAQNHAEASYAPPIEREHLVIDWRRSSKDIANQVRAFAPAPGAFTWTRGRRLKVLLARANVAPVADEPGRVLQADDGVQVSCGDGTLTLLRAQLEGRNAQDARALINGRAIEVGDVLGVHLDSGPPPDGIQG